VAGVTLTEKGEVLVQAGRFLPAVEHDAEGEPIAQIRGGDRSQVDGFARRQRGGVQDEQPAVTAGQMLGAEDEHPRVVVGQLHPPGVAAGSGQYVSGRQKDGNQRV
jgi:hypothetical protein